MLFFMFAAITAVTWGVFGKPYYGANAILMWGVGDAAAALIGIPFGRHKVMIKPVNGKKSWEGSIAMFIVSSICGLFVLGFCQKVSFPASVVLCLTGALAGTVTELFSPGEWDTVTVPVIIAAVLQFIDHLYY